MEQSKFIQFIVKIKSIIKRLTFNKQKFWDNRAKKFGIKSVINIDHPYETFEIIKNRDLNEITPHLQKLLSGNEKIILDYGCGVGRFTADLAQIINGKAIGVDITKVLIDQAFPSPIVEYKHVKVANIPLANESIDIIWVFAVLACINGNQLKETLNEMNRVLKKNGIICITENTSLNEPESLYNVYRQPAEYTKLVSFAKLEHVHDYADRGKGFDEKFSVMIGRKE